MTITHGLTIQERASGARTIQPASLAVIGLIATASAAAGAATAELDAAFPLNTPVLVTDVEAEVGKAGTGGTLASALEGVGDQTSPTLIVVRVPVGEDEEAQDAAVIGGTDGNIYTGISALLAAKSIIGLAPDILIAPGLDTAAVTAEMIIAAKKLRAFVYARAIGDTTAEAVTYRETFAARELMLIWPNFSGGFAGDAVARAAGLRARIDEEIGWHKTISNVPVNGVTGTDKTVYFDLLDPSTEAGVLNNAPVTTIIRNNGFRFWGNRTTAPTETPEWAFESAVRTSHALQDIIADTVAPFIDQPMTKALMKDLLETANAAFRQLVVEGRIIGAQAFFDADANPADQLLAGRPTFRIQFTPAAPLENPQIDLVITDYYYSGFADLLI